MTHLLRKLAGSMAVVAAVLTIPAMLFPTTNAGASPPVPPTVTMIPPGTGLHGHPFDSVPTTAAVSGAPVINLAARGYVEEEFLMSGGATVYQQSGLWLSNGHWGVSVAQRNVPYTTRLLVRYPTDPAKFNGTVVVEWLNESMGIDADPGWAQLYNELLSDGYAYVAVTAQTAGMDDLKAWDPVRYGTLGDSNDGQSYDIFTQTAEVIRSDNSILLGGLTPSKVIAFGDSQSTWRLDTYVNAIQPLTHAYDGFLGVSRSAFAAPIGSGLTSLSPFPALIRTDNTAPFMQLNTQTDVVVLDAAAARQPDNSYLRTWEVAGAVHIDEDESEYELAIDTRDIPSFTVPSCVFGTPVEGTDSPLDGINQVNNMPLFEVEDAALVALQKWVTEGIPPPHAPPLSTTPLFFGLYDLVNLDQHGNALGGIRLPEMQVPTEFYSPLNFSQISTSDLSPAALLAEIEGVFTLLGSGSAPTPALQATLICTLSGFFYNFSDATLLQLYQTPANYAAKFTAAAEADVAAGFMTPTDAAAAIANADAGFGPPQRPQFTIP
jgi:hypothetical protein